jgi:PAS domain S-box-containing protein
MDAAPPPIDPRRLRAGGPGDVLDQLADGYFELDRTSHYRRINAAGLRLVGRAPAELLGRHVLEVFPEIASSEVHRAVGRVLAGGGPEHIETYFAPLGMWALNSIYPLPDGVAIVSHDLTDRRRAEERDRALAAIVVAADDAIVTKTLDGTVTSWNPAAERLFGWTAAEMVGQSIAQIVPAEKRDELAEILARLGRGERIDHHETVRVAKNGRRIDVSVSISPLVDSTGRVIGGVKIGRDISARREAESLREDFLAAVSHDLKNPLSGLKAHAQLLLRALRRGDPPDPARLTRGLEAIDEAATRLAGQIDGLVEAARVQAGVAPALERAPVDLVALVRRCAEEQQATASNHVVRLETAVADLVGNWDAARLERVVANLLTNALKYSPGGGEIAIRIWRDIGEDGPWAAFAVRDQGIGIPAADLPYVFARFRRGGNVSGIAGAGIGLTGVKQIIEQHGGAVTVESVEGIGTTITVRLPMHPPPDSGPGALSPNAP